MVSLGPLSRLSTLARSSFLRYARYHQPSRTLSFLPSFPSVPTSMMTLVNWCFRSVPALSIFLWIFVCYQAVNPQIPSPWPWSRPLEENTHDWRRLDGWGWLYLSYTVNVHLCACVIFPCRLLWSMWNMPGEVLLAHAEATRELKGKYIPTPTTSVASTSVGSETGSMSSMSSPRSSSDSTVFDSPVLGSMNPSKTFITNDEVRHAIILPSYKEDLESLRETLSVLSSHSLAKSSYDVRNLRPLLGSCPSNSRHNRSTLQWRSEILLPNVPLNTFSTRSKGYFTVFNAPYIHRTYQARLQARAVMSAGQLKS